jgi:UDP-N-acetylglucosamine acyltransferase
MEAGMLNAKIAALVDIHPSAVIDPTAELGDGVVIGPYAVIGPNVVLGERTLIGPHVVIERDTVVGRECDVKASAVLGGDPQDLKYAGEYTQLVIGDRTRIREFATLNRGTAARGCTTIGSDCLIMAYTHIAHDCIIGDHVILSNAVNMGGHVQIDEWAIVGGMTPIHQFVRIGAHAFVGGATRVQKDIPPYVRVAGNPLKMYGLNTVGLQRRGVPESLRADLKQLYRLFFKSSLNVTQALAAARQEWPDPEPPLERFLSFIEASERGISIQ